MTDSLSSVSDADLAVMLDDKHEELEVAEEKPVEPRLLHTARMIRLRNEQRDLTKEVERRKNERRGEEPGGNR